MEQVLISKKDYINRNKSNVPKEGMLFVDYIKLAVNKKKRRMGENYGSNYTTVITHLNAFSKLHNATLYTNWINQVLLEEFIDYLLDCNHKQGYMKGLVDAIKAILPKFISIEDIKTIAQNLRIKGIAYGAFKNKVI